MPLRVRRVILSALAGGGLTAVGLSGPLSGGALAAEPTTGVDPAVGNDHDARDAGTDSDADQHHSDHADDPNDEHRREHDEHHTGQSATEHPAADDDSDQHHANAAALRKAATALCQRPESPRPAHAGNDGWANGSTAPSTTAPTATTPTTPTTPSGPSNVAAAPQLAAAQSEALAAMLAGSSASIRALDFYRIPLFLLPIYQAAAVQYGVPWPVLAAINEVETDFGTDLSVSTAGAVGWMQFMPETWLQYGVDARERGLRRPLQPCRRDLRRRALPARRRRLQQSARRDPRLQPLRSLCRIGAAARAPVRELPAVGHRHPDRSHRGQPARRRSQAEPDVDHPPGCLRAHADRCVERDGRRHAADPQGERAPRLTRRTALPGSTPAPSPTASAAAAERAANAAAPPSQLSELLARRGAPVVAVEDGRIVGIGHSHKLGRYLVLRDTYGDLFTYAGLGSIAPDYRLPKPDPSPGAQGRACRAAKAPVRTRHPSRRRAPAASCPSRCTLQRRRRQEPQRP